MRKLVATIAAAVVVAGAGTAVATQAAPTTDTPADASFLGGGGYRCFDDGSDFSFMCRSY